MALEAIQAQAGHRSIEFTGIYLHLATDWLAGARLRRSRRPAGTGRDARPLRLSDVQVDQVDRFVTALRAAGLTPWRSTEQAARTFSGRLQRVGGWAQLSRRQLEATKKAPAFGA